MKTGIVRVVMSMLVVFAIVLTGCSQKQYTCDVCGKTFTGTAYTDGDWEMVMCAKCATDYWYPLPIENYKITKEIEEHMKANGVGAQQGNMPSVANEPSHVTSDSADITAQDSVVQEKQDPLAILDITETGVYDQWCLKRGGRFYSLMDRLNQINPSIEYRAGMISPMNSSRMHLSYGFEGSQRGGMIDYEGVITFGDVPVPEYGEGDEIVLFSQSGSTELKLREVVFSGYSICLSRLYITNSFDEVRLGEMYYCSDPSISQSGVYAGENQIKNLQIKDMSGTIIEDLSNLTQGDEYIVSYEMGTSLYQYPSVASSRVYSYLRPTDRTRDWADYTIAGQPTTEGYAVYDVSNVKPGFYKIWGYGGLIQISGSQGDSNTEPVNETNPSEEHPDTIEQTIRVIMETVNVRGGAGTDHEIVTTANMNDVFRVLGSEIDGEGSAWYEIEIGGGRGYIRSDMVEGVN